MRAAEASPRPIAPPAEGGGGGSDNLRAGGALLMAMTMFSLNDAMVKWVTQDLSVPQVMAVRGVMLFAIVVGYLRFRGEPLFPPEMADWRLWLRSGFEITATIFFLTALTLLPFAMVTTLVFSSPLMLTAIAALFMGETVRTHRWSAVIIGFIGVVIVTEPWSATWSAAALLPLFAAAMTVGRDVLTRSFPRDLGIGHVVLATTLVVSVAGGVGWAFDPKPFALWTLPWCAGAAVLLGAAYAFIVFATRDGEISFVAPLRYVSIVLSAALGYAIWGEEPTTSLYLGATLIMASGLYILYRETRRSA